MQESRRVRMTKRMLKDSLLELLEKNPLNKITIKDICDNADVNRTTFYVYYESIEQLLADIENDVFAQIPLSRDVPTADSHNEFLEMLTTFFEYVRSNKQVFEILILKTDNSAFYARMIAAVKEKYKQQYFPGDSMLDEYESVYCIHGTMGMLKFWLESGFPFSGKKLAELALQMSIQATELDEHVLQEGLSGHREQRGQRAKEGIR